MMRLLDPSLIPKTLWSSDRQVLAVPSALAQAYARHIDSLGLRDLSAQRNSNDPPVGGRTVDATNEHYSQAFDSSAARVQLALLDPFDQLADVSNIIIRRMAGDRFSLVDAPCGVGAAALSILSTIAELRKLGSFPRSPLDVHLIGAEISDTARKYAEQLTALVEDDLADQAIFIHREFLPWDVLCNISNTDLIQRVVRVNADNRPNCLIIANFSAFLEKEKKRKEASPQLEELIRHTSRSAGYALWLEPCTNTATNAGGLLPWVTEMFSKKWKSLFLPKHISDDALGHLTSSARYVRVLNPLEMPRVNVAVVRSEFAPRFTS
jgi:hypothetical protein